VVNLPASFRGKLPSSITHNLEENVVMEADPETLFRVRANPSGGKVGCYSGVDANGFRNRAPSGAPLRIALLGDSCFFGLGLCDFRATLGPRLEAALAKRGLRYSVVNLSQPGFSSEQAKVLAERWLPQVRPELVVVGTGWNDLWPSPYYGDREVLRGVGRSPFRLLDLFRGLMARPPLPDPARRRVPLGESVENVRAIAGLARSLGARLVLVPLLHGPSVPSWLPDPAPYNAAMRAAFGSRELVADESLLRGKLKRDLFREDGYHPRGEGVEIEAQWIADTIARGRRAAVPSR
jgi:hypothetical protein